MAKYVLLYVLISETENEHFSLQLCLKSKIIIRDHSENITVGWRLLRGNPDFAICWRGGGTHIVPIFWGGGADFAKY